MAPLFIRRVETVVSLQQLEREVPASPLATGPSLEPDAPVAGIGGTKLPKYSFASDAAPRMSRLNSAADLARVPDVDDDAECRAASTHRLAVGGSSNGGSSASAATAAAAAAAAALGGGVTAAKAGAGSGAPSLAPLSNGGLLLRECALADAPSASGSGSASTGGDQLLDMVDGGSSCDGSVVDMLSSGSGGGGGGLPTKSLLDGVLLAMWEECSEQGLFRYDVTACPTKVVPGLYGFVAQLNEGRYSKKRPTEFRVDQVVQPFDAAKFNFTKAFRREVLFAFEPARPKAGAATAGPTFEEAGRASRSPSVVLINVSPIDYGHVLLCPRVLDCLPQNLDPGVLRLALHFALDVGNPYLRVGFNSLGAFATINHLHFQAYYLAAPLPCERAPTRPLPLECAGAGGDGGDDSHPVAISLLDDYPVRGWVVEGPSLAGMAQVVGEASLALQGANIPHNVLIADCGSRVFLWPQAYAERQARGLVPEALLDVGVNPAIWEISGHMVLKRAADYDGFTEDAAWELLAAVSLSEADMAALSAQLFDPACTDPVGTGCVLGAEMPPLRPGGGSQAAQGGAEPMAGVEQEQEAPRCSGGGGGNDAAMAAIACCN